MPSDTLLAHNANTAERPRPKLILPIGSGRTGKCFWSRWFIDRAAEHRSQLEIIDGDTINPGWRRFARAPGSRPRSGAINRHGSKKPSNPLDPQPE